MVALELSAPALSIFSDCFLVAEWDFPRPKAAPFSAWFLLLGCGRFMAGALRFAGAA